jgi:alpha-glucoside transport system permease protein
MQQTTEVESRSSSPLTLLTASVSRIAAAVVVPLVTFIILWQGFLFLRDSGANQIVIALVAIVWGVGGVGALFWVSNWVVEQLPTQWVRRIQPFVFVGPAMAILTWFLLLPTLRTLWISFQSTDPSNTAQTQFVGIENYIKVFTERTMLEAFRNNVLWMIVGTSLCVAIGLLVAILADRSKFETLAKVLIFLPMAISFVGAGVIWRFVYAFAPADQPQIGLLNAVVTGFGGDPQAWLQLIQPWNNLFLIVVLVWLQTGFAVVTLSAALKGVPEDILEAARVDGATEIQIFFRIIIPAIQGTIITVATTILIVTLKIFDVVMAMTGGKYGTQVIATEFYVQFFTNRDFGAGSAIAIVLLVAVIPVMLYNLSEFNKREVF